MEIIKLDTNFSTTRRVTEGQPHITNSPDSKIKNLLLLPLNLERKGEWGLRTQVILSVIGTIQTKKV